MGGAISKEKAIEVLQEAGESHGRADLSNVQMESDVAVSLSQQLAKSMVVELNLSMNNVGDRGAAALAHALEKNRQLQRLELANNGVGAKGACALVEALATNKSLRVLDLYGNQVGLEGCRAFADAFSSQTCCIQKLMLGANGIGDEEVSLLANGLCKNKKLRELNLTGNTITSEGASSLAEMLKTNRSLTHLSMSSHALDDASLGDQIRTALDQNKARSVLNIWGTSQIQAGDLHRWDLVRYAYRSGSLNRLMRVASIRQRPDALEKREMDNSFKAKKKKKKQPVPRDHWIVRKEVTIRDGTTKSSHPCGRLTLGDRVYALDTNTDSHGVLRVQSTNANEQTGWAKVMHSDGTPNLEFVGGSAILSSRSDAVDTDGGEEVDDYWRKICTTLKEYDDFDGRIFPPVDSHIHVATESRSPRQPVDYWEAIQPTCRKFAEEQARQKMKKTPRSYKDGSREHNLFDDDDDGPVFPRTPKAFSDESSFTNSFSNPLSADTSMSPEKAALAEADARRSHYVVRKEVTLRDGTTKSSHPCGRLLLDEKVYPIEENTDAAGVLRVNCMQPAQGTQEARSGWAKVYHSDGTPNLEFVDAASVANMARLQRGPLPPAPYLLQKAQVESVATTAEADVLGALDSINFDEPALVVPKRPKMVVEQSYLEQSVDEVDVLGALDSIQFEEPVIEEPKGKNAKAAAKLTKDEKKAKIMVLSSKKKVESMASKAPLSDPSAYARALKLAEAGKWVTANKALTAVLAAEEKAKRKQGKTSRSVGVLLADTE